MFDYARKLKLAAQDSARRMALKVAAGLILAVGGGFLLAAFWSFLAVQLGLGSTLASLIVGGLFVIIGLLFFAASVRVKHKAPKTDELKAEVEARVARAADVASEKAKAKALEVIDMAQNSANSLVDRVSYKADLAADRAEGKVLGLAQGAASAVGIDRHTLDNASDMVERMKSSRAGAMAPLLGAFAIGVVIADRISGRD